MKIPKTFFLPNNAAGVNWWRQVLYFREMQKHKVDTVLYGYIPGNSEVVKWEYLYDQDKFGKGIREQIHSLMKWCDVAVLGYARYPATLSMMEAFKSDRADVAQFTGGSKKIICDIDDFVEDTPTYNPAYKSGWKPGGMYSQVPVEHIRMSDVVINATEWLAEEHKVYNKNSIVIPNSVDEEWWTVKKPEKRSKKIRIGWSGGGNHDEDFRVMPRVIETILAKYSNVEFYFVHGAPEYIRSLDKRVRSDNDWSPIEKYPQFIANYRFDIGIAPLDGNRFNYGKSNIKWLENSILGVPGVYTDIEPYKAIKDGVDGFKVLKIAEWTDRLSMLIESEDLRIRMGHIAKERVLKDFNLKDTTLKYLKVLEGLK